MKFLFCSRCKGGPLVRIGNDWKVSLRKPKDVTACHHILDFKHAHVQGKVSVVRTLVWCPSDGHAPWLDGWLDRRSQTPCQRMRVHFCLNERFALALVWKCENLHDRKNKRSHFG